MKQTPHLSLYWKCQLIGWSAAAMYWEYLGFTSGNYMILPGVLEFLSDVVTYIVLTHLYRNFALSHHWDRLNISHLIKRLIPAALVMGAAYTVVTLIKIYLFHLLATSGFSQPFAEFIRLNWLGMSIAGIRLMSIWLLAYHLYHYAQREINIAKENAQLTIIAKDAQLNNLSAQLNPHFLFNSLNNIKALVIENPKSARRAIDLLSDLLRTSLYSRDVLLTTVKEELGLVKDYLELEKLRLEERLQYFIIADDQMGNIPILRFSIQILAENAIKHGIDRQKEGGAIAIKAGLVNGFIHISVENPGTIINNIGRQGVGIKNLTERLQLHYKGKATFSMVNEPGGTVLSTLIIPQ